LQNQTDGLEFRAFHRTSSQAPQEAHVNALVIVLRILHIGSGVFWVGASSVTGIFLSPTLAGTGDAGQKVLAHLITKAKFSIATTVAAIITVLAGGTLYWIDSQGLTSKWTLSGPGLGFALGGVAALVGVVFGMLVGMNTSALGRLAAEINGKPTPEQTSRIQAARKTLSYAGPISTVALVLALLLMATARYWVF